MTDNPVFQTPWRNLQGCECRITSTDYKKYSFHVGDPYNISVDGFTSSVAANTAMQERVTVLKALSSTEFGGANKKPEPVEEKPKRRRASTKVTEVAAVAAVAAVIPIKSKRKGRPPKQTYTFTEAEDAALVPVPAVATEDW